MRAMFIARGPNIKKNMIIKPFLNVNVYSLICELASIQCNPSNGTLDTLVDIIDYSHSTKTLFSSIVLSLGLCITFINDLLFAS